jgi:hypothetical protein
MRVLIACELSGVVREAFNAYAGVEAVSCDILPPADGRTDYHLQGDVRNYLEDGWDAMIAFPPCTYLCSSGLHWIARGRIEADGRPRSEHYREALEFVRTLLAAPIPRIALENPTGAIGSQIRPAEQWIQPHEYGEDASKKTGLWLKNLPPLKPTRRVPGRLVECRGKIVERWANQTDGGQNKLTPSETRGMERGLTYPGIAQAMADQWAPLL